MRTMQIATKLKGWMQAAAAVALVATLAACGGGSSGSSGNNSSDALNGGTLPASPTLQPTATGANTAPITVGKGVGGVINIPTVSVTVCAPGSTTICQTINNIQVDTGSFGLRVVSTALSTSVLNALPVSTQAVTGAPLAECATFADGYTWGSVRTATIGIGGETTSTSIPMQIIGDKSTSSLPTGSCGTGAAENTASDLGANGILGIGTAPNDCGSDCLTLAYSNYFACPSGSSTCARTTVTEAQQVTNPVTAFPVDNNGVVVQLPPVSNTGSAGANGTLVFGVGTQPNNALTASQSFPTDVSGNLNNSVFNGATVQAFLDSGSNAYFFGDSTLALCSSAYSGFYCPSSAQTRSITLGGQSGATASASIGILSAATLFGNGSNYAFNNLAGQIGGNADFDLGLPFFYGRHVFYGIDKTSTGGAAPFVAF
jgi:Protein of unknown function (DUF3443)